MRSQISTKKFLTTQKFQRNYLMDLLKTIAIIGVIIDNILGATSDQFKAIGGYF